CHHHDGPARLTISDDRGLTFRLWVKINHVLNKGRLRAGDILDRLTWNWFREEPNEVTGMAGLHGHADLAFWFESAYSGAMTRSRINDHEWALIFVWALPVGWNDANERIVHGLGKLT